jgi:hypothetical protein
LLNGIVGWLYQKDFDAHLVGALVQMLCATDVLVLNMFCWRTFVMSSDFCITIDDNFYDNFLSLSFY